MRKIEQKQLAGLITTAMCGIQKIKTKQLGMESVAVLLAECLRAFEAVETAVCTSVSDKRQQAYRKMTDRITAAVKELAAALDYKETSIERKLQEVTGRMEELRQEILSENEIQYVIVFLPYKASMWDSMDSIWQCAKNDPQCRVYAVPIPYFDKMPDGSLGEMHYEGNQMPDYVDVSDCTMLHMEALLPDVVYIHNPYDQYNHVTSVHPAFYSAELKKYTELLVYVSYSIPGVYESAEGAASFCQTSGMYYADLIIAQSQVHKMLLIGNGHHKDKIAVLGNPKLDYVLNHLNDYRMPDTWKRLNGRKVFLVSISIGSFLAWEKIIEMYDAFIEMLVYQYHASVIYRPHPLLEASIQSMRPHKYRQYINFLNKYSVCDGFVLDKMEDPMAAVSISDCMIGDYSSLCFSYAVTGKPVAMTVYGDPPGDELYYAFDYRGICFINVSDYLEKEKIPQDFENFIIDMINDHDCNKEERMELLKSSVVNLDGTCGQKIHAYIMECVRRRWNENCFIDL